LICLISEYSLERLNETYKHARKIEHKKTPPKQCFFIVSRQPRDNRRKHALAAGQYAARFVVALLPVRFIHAGNYHTATGRSMDKLVIANVDAYMATR
jgi:hypothetical protein